jgi:hypothetical protein
VFEPPGTLPEPPQTAPVPETTPDELTCRHWVDPEMLLIVIPAEKTGVPEKVNEPAIVPVSVPPLIVGLVNVLFVAVCVSVKVKKTFAAMPSNEEAGAVVELGTAGMINEEANGPLVVGHP